MARTTAAEAAREATKGSEQAPAYVPTVLPPLASGLPQTADRARPSDHGGDYDGPSGPQTRHLQ
jgi:hypothetical protein